MLFCCPVFASSHCRVCIGTGVNKHTSSGIQSSEHSLTTSLDNFALGCFDNSHSRHLWTTLLLAALITVKFFNSHIPIVRTRKNDRFEHILYKYLSVFVGSPSSLHFTKTIILRSTFDTRTFVTPRV